MYHQRKVDRLNVKRGGKCTINPYHSSRIIMISMDAEHWQTNIEVGIFIIYMAKSVKNDKLLQISDFSKKKCIFANY